MAQEWPGLPGQRGPGPLLDKDLERIAGRVQIVDVPRTERDEPPTVGLKRTVRRLVRHLLREHESLGRPLLLAQREREAVLDDRNVRAVRMQLERLFETLNRFCVLLAFG